MKPDALIADRYRIVSHEDAGAFADVYLAEDQLTNTQVALKWLYRGSPRREAVAMRATQIPGVARLIDDGMYEGRAFLVTAWIDGHHFPGEWTTLPWVELRPLAIALLKIVARLHARQTHHLDLKPANVLVADDQIWVLDLGLADGAALGAAAAQSWADRSIFTAPELQSGHGSARSDLYAIGMMIAQSAEDLPERARALIDQLCAANPDDRPPDAWSALTTLGEPSLEPPTLPASAHLTASALRPLLVRSALFDRERALAHILAESNGAPEAVCALLRRWLRMGWAWMHPDGARLCISTRWAEETQDASPLRRARVALRDGLMDEARRWVRQGLLTDPEDEAPLVRIGALAAMDTFRAEYIVEALYWIGRARSPQPVLEALLRVAHMTRIDSQSSRAQRAIERLPPTEDIELQAVSFALRMQVANFSNFNVMQAELDRMPAQLRGHPETQARVLGWQGRVAYRRQDYAESAALHLQACRRSAAPSRALAASLNAVAALIEAGEFEQAMRIAARDWRAARTIQHDFLALRAHCLGREAAWRAGRPLHPDIAYVTHAERFGPRWQVGLLALTEASGAWRQGAQGLARTLSDQAIRLLTGSRYDRGALQLAQALRASAALVPEVCDALAELTVERAWPDLDWQILGIIASTPRGRRWHAIAQARAQTAPDPDRRREVFSPREVIDGIWAPACQHAMNR